MEISFKDKVAFIVGASVGIGAAVAKTLASSGAKVSLMARQPDPLQKLADEINSSGGVAIAIPGDVSKSEDVENAIHKTVEKFGALHLAVNNAAIPGDFGLLHESTSENWRKVMGVNLDGIYYCMKSQIATMLKGGGSIVNVGSVEGITILPHNGAYTATKHALVGLTNESAYEYAKQGVRINVVAPGIIDTRLTQGQPALAEQIVKAIPVGRMGTPQEVANVIAFVLSDQASYMYGSNVVVDGAFLLHQPI